MNKVDERKGRFGNHFFHNMAAHFISLTSDVRIEYSSYVTKMNELGIYLHQGSTTYDRCMDIHESDLMNHIHHNHQTNVVLGGYSQIPEFVLFLDEYLLRPDISQSIRSHNRYQERYGKNNDVFIHVRLGDAAHQNDGFDYYDTILSSISFEKGYLTSDGIHHEICQKLIKKYHLTLFSGNEVDTIMFGSTCRYIVLSQGTFSWMIGMFSLHESHVYCRKKAIWHGDIFILPHWTDVTVQK